jgi:MFS family permease
MDTHSRPANAGALSVVVAAALLLALSMGSRSSLGLFFSPLNTATGLGIATISFAAALGQLVWGVAQPACGALSDRYGPARVIFCGGLALAAGTALVPFAHTGAALALALGIAAAGGAACGGNSLLLSVVSRRVAPARRGLASGAVGAGGSTGQLVIAPAVQLGIATAGWMSAMFALAALALATLPLARFFRQRDEAQAPPPEAGDAPAGDAGWRTGLRSPAYWLITAGFFVCGFHVQFLLAHMPGVIELCGLPATLSGAWLAIVGLCNVIGSIASGALIQRAPMALTLTGLYGLRAAGIALFLVAPKTELTMLAFAVWMGLTYMATLPPTAGLVGKLYGTRHLGALLGGVMLVHQVGAFLGVWLGGVAVEVTGTYEGFWLADIALAVIAALIHLAVREDRSTGRGAPTRDPAWRLRDGRTAIVRSVEPSDAGAIQAFVRGLSSDARRRRFFSAIRELHPERLERLVRPDARRAGTFVALSGSEAPEVVAIAEYALQPNASGWDIAVVVADAWQRQGLGERLIGHLLDQAAAAGITRVEGDILRDNRPMIRLARRSGFGVSHHPLDAKMVRIARTLGIAPRKTAVAAGA